MKTSILFLALALPACAWAQPETAPSGPANGDTALVAMHLVARHYGDSIVLRWAPGGSAMWLLANTDGYCLRRQAFRRDEKNVFNLLDSSTTIVKPWSMEQWAAQIQATDDSLAVLAAGMLYGETRAFGGKTKGVSMEDILQKYTEQQNRFVFALMAADQSPVAAEGLGWRYADRSVEKGLYYLYTVHPVGEKAAARMDTGRVLMDDKKIHVPQPFPAITAIPGDRVIHLFWPEGDLINNQSYSAYVVERSADGIHFERLHHRPLIPDRKREEGLPKPIRYDDSVAVNYRTYTYRVSGLSAFGDLSPPSPPLAVMAVDLTAPSSPVITEIGTTSEGAIHLTWEKPDMEGDMRGFVVGRATNMEGPYEPLTEELLPPDTRRFTDTQPHGGAPNFYIVAAVDTAGNPGRSLPAYHAVDDHTPPDRPTGLDGQIDSTGRVFLHWRWNREKDLVGYRVFFSNSGRGVFAPATGHMLSDTLFVDSTSLRTLSRHLYYKVIAYDRNMNASEPSDILKLERPDTIPPMPALIHDFSIGRRGVTLHWHPSASGDAARQHVLRQADSTGAWRLLAQLPPGDTLFTDTTVASGMRYAYAIETFDRGGLSSGRSFPLRAYVHRSTAGNGIHELEAVLQEERIMLRWKAPEQQVNFYILYRSMGDDGMRLAGNIPGDQSGYTDRAGTSGTRYAIKAVYADGSTSPLSNVASVRMP